MSKGNRRREEAARAGEGVPEEAQLPVGEAKPAKPVKLEGGLEALKPQHAAIDLHKLGLEMLPPVIRSARDVAGELAEKIRQGEGIAAWMAATLQRLEEYEAADAAVQTAMKDEVDQAKRYLDGLMGHADPVIRRGVYLALFHYKLGQAFVTHEACMSMFDNMERNGWLVATREPSSEAVLPGGNLSKSDKAATIYGRTYNLPSKVVIGDKDVAELRRLYQELRGRTERAVMQDRSDRFKALIERATISIEQCRDHSSGLVAFEVPEEREGGRRWQGGWLLMKSDGRRMFVEDVVNERGYGGAGMFERVVREMMANRPHLLVDETFDRVDSKVAYRLGQYVIKAIEAYNKTKMTQQQAQASKEESPA